MNKRERKQMKLKNETPAKFAAITGKIKKKTLIMIAVVVIATAITGIIVFRPKEAELNLYEAKRTDLSQEVSLTGKVQAAESVELSFERSGRIASVNVSAGDAVRAGDIIASLDNSKLEAELARAEAELGRVTQGARPEEITVRRAVVENTKLLLEVAEKDLEDTLADNKGKINEVIVNKLDRFFTNPKTDPNLNFRINDFALEAKIESERTLLESKLSGWSLADGILKEADAAIAVFTAVRNLSNSFLIAFGDNIVTVYSQATIDGWESDTASVRSSASASASTIASARGKYIEVSNSLAVAEKDLALVLAGSSAFQIDSARAAVNSVMAEINKGIIRTPITSVVGKVDIVVGETASIGAPIATVISDKKFQIEAFIPEADIAKIRAGNQAEVTLDAYGSEVVFQARVISIDIGETMIEGVTSYGAIIEFVDEDKRVKSGMTANINVFGSERKDVIAVPQRMVIMDDGRKFLNILQGEDVVRVEVKTGFRSSDGRVEITDGLSEGDKVVVSLPTP